MRDSNSQPPQKPSVDEVLQSWPSCSACPQASGKHSIPEHSPSGERQVQQGRPSLLSCLAYAPGSVLQPEQEISRTLLNPCHTIIFSLPEKQQVSHLIDPRLTCSSKGLAAVVHSADTQC